MKKRLSTVYSRIKGGRMDKIVISGIKISTLIGVHPWEQRIPQNIYLDIALQTFAERAAQEDDLHEAIDYDQVVAHLLAYTKENHFKLIETLAERLANEVLSHFSTKWVQITLNKPGALKTAKNVAITIERTRP